MAKLYKLSEIFGDTFQGEATYAGIPTIWIRWWACNFTCAGFGQSHLPKEQWIDPYADIDIEKYKTVEELPVFPIGCDSGYSWSKKFSHLAQKRTPEEITTKLRSFLTGGTFQHPKSKQWTHMAFTGGEPMISQSATAEVMEQFHRENDVPKFVTIETNGTQLIRAPFMNFFSDTSKFPGELFWSVSPKLSTSGEQWSQAIKPDIVKQYANLSNAGQLKYVGDGSNQNWDEIEKATEEYRKVGVEFPVWVMPVGATREEQEDIQAMVAEGAITRGYNVAARLHCWVFGNVVGK